MKNYCIFSFFLILSTLWQCTHKEEKGINHHNATLGFGKWIEQVNIKVPKEAYNNYMHLQVYKDSLLYGINPNSPYQISVFNLKLQNFENNIELENYLFKEKPGAFYIHNPDSIFVTGTNYPLVYIISKKGEVINKFNLKDFGLNKEGVIPSIFHYTSPYYDSKKKYLFLTILPLDWDQLERSTNRFTQAVFDLTSQKMIAEYAPIQKNNKGILPYDLNIPYRLIKGDSIFISYPTHSIVEIYNKITFQKISEKNVLDNKNLQEIQPLSLNKAQDEQELWNFRIAVPFFEPIFYHYNLKYFSLVFHHAQELKPDGKKLNDGSNRDATMFVFDENFNLLKKQEFTNSFYGVRKAVPLSNGLLFAPHEKYWASEDTLSLKYKIKI